MTHDHSHASFEPISAGPPAGRALRIGVGGPVGSGKTALVAACAARWPASCSWAW